MEAPRLSRGQRTRELRAFASAIRRHILEVAVGLPGGCHLPSSLSMVEILAVLYGAVLSQPLESEGTANGDRFVLSKGHAALALYATLAARGALPEGLLREYGRHGSPLSVHPRRNTDLGIEATTGSLGHGLSFAVGLSLARAYRNGGGRVLVALGDGECQEGETWEAASFASSRALTNLVAIIDLNGLQQTSPLVDGARPDTLAARWRAAGWRVRSIDGHDVSALLRVFSDVSIYSSPTAVIARTIKGKGLQFLENDMRRHYTVLSVRERDEIRRRLSTDRLV
ncbi:MAG TPA: 1-deoxy-D-xylulose-5-phosphate synthase N-terminal domain-containing protein [Gemmatimonadaceae bacterium]